MFLGNVTNIRMATVTLSGATSTTAADFTFSLPGIMPGDGVIMTAPSGVGSTIAVRNPRCETANVLTITARADAATPSLSGAWAVTIIRPEGFPLPSNVFC